MAKEIIEAPMSGKILRVNSRVGDALKEGDVVCVLESMKMENEILTPVAGKVAEINAKEAQFVKGGDVLAVIEY